METAGQEATAGSGTDPMPARIKPMLARSGSLPEDPSGWAAEIKWDGYRAAAHCRRGGLELLSRNGRDLSARFPEIHGLCDDLGSRNVILDGEIVAFDRDGLPSFGALQRRLQPAGEGVGGAADATYVIFDLLYLDGSRLTGLPYRERRAQLAELDAGGPHWQAPEYATGDLEGLLRASRDHGLEGMVLKRLDSRYEPGRRSAAWIKLRNVRRQELVVGGWLPGEGARQGRPGALLVGVWEDGDGDRRRLRYMGRVGSGLGGEAISLLEGRLADLHARTSPFDERPPPGTVHVRPEIVVEVEYTERTDDGRLRHPTFKGLRLDKVADDVVWEGSPTAGRAPSTSERPPGEEPDA